MEHKIIYNNQQYQCSTIVTYDTISRWIQFPNTFRLLCKKKNTEKDEKHKTK